MMTYHFDPEIITAKKCPYCGGYPELTDSEKVYGKSYGLIYLCDKCWAYVGVHKGTEKALGRLANEGLRKAKGEAHWYFDQLWIRKMGNGFSKREARQSAYKWLSAQIGIPEEFTHIGMFDEELCKKVVEVCKPYFITK